MAVIADSVAIDPHRRKSEPVAGRPVTSKHGIGAAG